MNHTAGRSVDADGACGPDGGACPRAVPAVLLFAYGSVIIALTCLKSFFTIGLLWRPENQRVRELVLIPFEKFFTAKTWFGPVFDAAGNIAFFLPFGWLLAVLVLRGRRGAGRAGGVGPARRAVRVAALAGAGLSLAIELFQLTFSLGRTDITDLLLNTAGAAAGAWLACQGGRVWHRVLMALTATAVVVFAVLVVLGPRLGDPDKFKPVASPGPTPAVGVERWGAGAASASAAGVGARAAHSA